MDDRDILIASLRRQLNEQYSKNSALEQEIAVLKDDRERLKDQLKTLAKHIKT